MRGAAGRRRRRGRWAGGERRKMRPGVSRRWRRAVQSPIDTSCAEWLCQTVIKFNYHIKKRTYRSLYASHLTSRPVGTRHQHHNKPQVKQSEIKTSKFEVLVLWAAKPTQAPARRFPLCTSISNEPVAPLTSLPVLVHSPPAPPSPYHLSPLSPLTPHTLDVGLLYLNVCSGSFGTSHTRRDFSGLTAWWRLHVCSTSAKLII